MLRAADRYKAGRAGCSQRRPSPNSKPGWISPVQIIEFRHYTSPNFIEVAVPAEPVLEPARARYTVLDQRFAPVVPFLNQRLAYAKPVTLDGGAPIGPHANLREPRDLSCQLLRFLTGAPLG